MTASVPPGDGPALVERIVIDGAAPLLLRSGPPAGAGFALFGLARKLLGARATGEELQMVLRGLPHNRTTEMDLDLWQLARRIREDETAVQPFLESSAWELAAGYQAGSLPAVAQEGLAAFLRDYGHRAVAEIDVGLPRWSEDPTHILGVLANYLRIDKPDLEPDAQFARAERRAEATVVELPRRMGASLSASVVGFCLRRTRELVGLRETPKYNLVVLLAELRSLLRAVGQDLAKAGRLDAAEDVFFLYLPDARAALEGADFRPIVRDRRVAYDRELRRRRVPRVLMSDGTEPETQIRSGTSGHDGLVGVPASAGVVTAAARVVFDPVGARLEPGEILVAPSTDPGWTPLFLAAAGLVMEMGGVNSHGAVVAREYGIPAVVGLPGATESIESGRTITVDGSAGTVTLAPE